MSYQVCLSVDDNIISQYTSCHPMGKTLRLAAQLLQGVSMAEVTIRRNGDCVAWFLSDWRGDLTSVEIYTHYPAGPRGTYGRIQVTPMNPRADFFAAV